MRALQLLCFIFIGFGLVACLDKKDDPEGEQQIEVVHAAGDVTGVRPSPEGGTEIDIEIGVGGGCDSFLSFEYAVDYDRKEITVIAKNLSNITDGIYCTMQYEYYSKTLNVNMLPPFKILYSYTGAGTKVDDFDDWTNYQSMQ